MSPQSSPAPSPNQSEKPSPDEKLGSAKLHNRIALRAYQLWEDSGHEHGNDLKDWFTAEQEVLAASMGADQG
jgi:hypothetical protein